MIDIHRYYKEMDETFAAWDAVLEENTRIIHALRLKIHDTTMLWEKEDSNG